MKTIVSMGDTGGIPTGAGEHLGTKPGGRSQDGCRVPSVLARPQTKV